MKGRETEMIDFSQAAADIKRPEKTSEVFRFYSRCRKERPSLFPEQWLADEGERLICRSVTRALYRLSRQTNGSDLLKIAEIVYFSDAHLPLKKGDMSMKVVKASISLHYSERQIYYQLKFIGKVFSEVLNELEIFN